MLNRNIAILFFLYAISWCVLALAFTATASIGATLSSNKNLALLPLITQVMGSVFITFPASSIMRRYGRRAGFVIGSALGALGALLCVYGVYIGNFWLLVAATSFVGMFTGFSEFIKYAASDIHSDDDMKRRAISVIVSSGVISAFVGPWIASFSNEYFLYIKPYFGPYLSVFGFCFLALILSALLNMKRDAVAGDAAETTVSFSSVLRVEQFVVGTMVAGIAYLVMAALMDAMPITMMDHGFSFHDTTQVLQWHLLAMFAPSFLTSKFINRYGAINVVFLGILINFIGICIALAGTDYLNFWISLFLIGVGWNLMFLAGVGVIATISDDIRPAAEGASNAILVVCFAISAPIASVILFQLGWSYVSGYAALLLFAALVVVLTKRRAIATNQGELA